MTIQSLLIHITCAQNYSGETVNLELKETSNIYGKRLMHKQQRALWPWTNFSVTFHDDDFLRFPGSRKADLCKGLSNGEMSDLWLKASHPARHESFRRKTWQ
jgi:hypothetical protein